MIAATTALSIAAIRQFNPFWIWLLEKVDEDALAEVRNERDTCSNQTQKKPRNVWAAHVTTQLRDVGSALPSSCVLQVTDSKEAYSVTLASAGSIGSEKCTGKLVGPPFTSDIAWQFRGLGFMQAGQFLDLRTA